MNIPKYIELFRNELQRKGYRTNSIENYASQVRCFLKQFASRDRARNITADEIEQYKGCKIIEQPVWHYFKRLNASFFY